MAVERQRSYIEFAQEKYSNGETSLQYFDEYLKPDLEATSRTYTDKQKMYQFKKDGLTVLFVELVNADKSLLEDSYIKKWYRLSC